MVLRRICKSACPGLRVNVYDVVDDFDPVGHGRSEFQ